MMKIKKCGRVFVCCVCCVLVCRRIFGDERLFCSVCYVKMTTIISRSNHNVKPFFPKFVDAYLCCCCYCCCFYCSLSVRERTKHTYFVCCIHVMRSQQILYQVKSETDLVFLLLLLNGSSGVFITSAFTRYM